MEMSRSKLRDFVEQSYAIEGIFEIRDEDIAIHSGLLEEQEITVNTLQGFVWTSAGAPLRQASHPLVCVGRHVAPPGGDTLHSALEWLCINARHIPPIQVHDAYMWLHPFMDGNGRSGRALWLWCLKQRGWLNPILAGRPILQELYYQHLDSLDWATGNWWRKHGYVWK